MCSTKNKQENPNVWDTACINHTKSINLDPTHTIITQINDSIQWKPIFGLYSFEPNQMHSETHTFKLKILTKKNRMKIGIIASESKNERRNFGFNWYCDNLQENSLAYDKFNCWHYFGKNCIFKSGDLIEIVLDLRPNSGNTLSFVNNGKYVGVAFGDLDYCAYCVCVTMRVAGDSIQLVS